MEILPITHARVQLQQTKAELRAAKRAVVLMASANTFQEVHEAWQTFLDKIEKVWLKAERECQPYRQAFEPWQGRYKRIRREDPLLTYLHHARNADHHTIQLVSAIAKDVCIKIPPGGTASIEFDHATGKIRCGGDMVEHAVSPAKYVLLAVTDRGIQYDPPTSHLGADLTNTDVLTVARLGLEFYSQYVAKIEQEFLQDQ